MQIIGDKTVISGLHWYGSVVLVVTSVKLVNCPMLAVGFVSNSWCLLACCYL